jgi:hypothetical protein
MVVFRLGRRAPCLPLVARWPGHQPPPRPFAGPRGACAPVAEVSEQIAIVAKASEQWLIAHPCRDITLGDEFQTHIANYRDMAKRYPGLVEGGFDPDALRYGAIAFGMEFADWINATHARFEG